MGNRLSRFRSQGVFILVILLWIHLLFTGWLVSQRYRAFIGGNGDVYPTSNLSNNIEGFARFAVENCPAGANIGYVSPENHIGNHAFLRHYIYPQQLWHLEIDAMSEFDALQPSITKHSISCLMVEEFAMVNFPDAKRFDETRFVVEWME